MLVQVEKSVQNDPVLVKYVRDKKGTPHGVIVAVGRDEVGYALARKGEIFRKEFGKRIAIGRALKHGTKLEFPSSLERVKTEMMDRSRRYFKD